MRDIIFFIKNHFFLILLWFVSFVLVVFFSTKYFFSRSKIINHFFAVKLINKKNAIVIDTRKLIKYNSGHIINSIHMPFQHICKKKLKELNILTSIPIILIIDSLDDYNKYIKKFIQYEFNAVYVLKNGMDLWNSENLPVVVLNK